MLTRDHEPEVDTSTRDTTPIRSSGQRHNNGPSIAGLVLILVGVLALLSTITQSALAGELTVLGMGMIFLIWGISARLAAPLIPGCILTGLGIGIVLSQNTFTGFSEDTQGGLVVLGLALGFLAIPAVTYAVKRFAPWWLAIPGGIMLVVGLALVVGGAAMTVLDVLGVIWPVILIVIGVALLLHRAVASDARHSSDRELPQ
jgi:hypothetical protein